MSVSYLGQTRLIPTMVGRPSYSGFVTSLAPVLWYRFTETAGTTAANAGSFGSAQNGVWTPGVGALGQTGALGTNEAYDFDGADSLVSITQTGSNVGGIGAYTLAFLFNADTTGEGTTGSFYVVGSTGATLRFNGANIRAIENNGAAVVLCTTTGTFVTLSEWQWLFMTFNDAGDRLARLYRGKNGALTEATYGSTAALTGTRATLTGAVEIGNRTGADRSFDGRIDEALVFSSVLSVGQMTDIVLASGV